MTFKNITKTGIFFIVFFSTHIFSCESNTFNIKNMSLAQKIAQLMMPAAVVDEEVAKDVIAAKPYKLNKDCLTTLIKDYGVGGILLVGPSDPDKQIKRLQHYQDISSIPLLIGQDLEPGRIGASRLKFMNAFSNNQTLGKINDIAKTYQTGFDIGQRCRQLGVHINFAPVADVNNNPNNSVINDRSFGDNPKLVAKHAIAFAQGLSDSKTIPCAKHFPGHGDTDIDSHNSLPKISHDMERLNSIELCPFSKLIDADIPAIMIAHVEVPALEPQAGLPASLSNNVVTEYLQKKLGFKNLIATDALDMGALSNQGTDGQIELKALLAGVDILLAPINVPFAIAAIKKAVENGFISEDEINRHVQKILDIKRSIFKR